MRFLVVVDNAESISPRMGSFISDDFISPDIDVSFDSGFLKGKKKHRDQPYQPNGKNKQISHLLATEIVDVRPFEEKEPVLPRVISLSFLEHEARVIGLPNNLLQLLENVLSGPKSDRSGDGIGGCRLGQDSHLRAAITRQSSLAEHALCTRIFVSFSLLFFFLFFFLFLVLFLVLLLSLAFGFLAQLLLLLVFLLFLLRLPDSGGLRRPSGIQSGIYFLSLCRRDVWRTEIRTRVVTGFGRGRAEQQKSVSTLPYKQACRGNREEKRTKSTWAPVSGSD